MNNLVLHEKKELLSSSEKKKYLGILTLNRPKALNSLNLEMIEVLQEKLKDWEEDPDLALVILQSASEKAFCAGGDVRVLGEGLKSDGENAYGQADTFFLEEFFTDYYIHKMKTPTLAWADHIVMGGGMGLIAGMDFRVVTERSLLAMPEITIGYIPDVGASYFLNKVPGNLGLYLGLTGMRIKGEDAVYLGFANFHVHSSKKEFIMEEICKVDWKDSNEQNKGILKSILSAQQSKDIQSPLSLKKEEVDQAMQGESLEAIQENILSLEGNIFNASKDSFLKGSPTSKALILEQFKRAKSMNLEDCFSMEWVLAAKLARHPDFSEGIRALLIDKDNAPNWAPPESVKIDSFFNLPSSIKENPLAKKIKAFLSK